MYTVSWHLLAIARQKMKSKRRVGSWVRQQSTARALGLVHKHSKRNSKRFIRKSPKANIDILTRITAGPIH